MDKLHLLMSFLSQSLRTISVLPMITVCLQAAELIRPKSELLTIENKAVKIGIDRSMGASITWLSWQAHPENIINIHDPGRLLQQSYYAGKNLDRQEEGQSKHWSPWSWNPIQGGGVNSWARVSVFKKTREGGLYAETIPKLWDMPDEEAAAVMRQICRFDPEMPNVIQVHNQLICKRKPDDRWGAAVPRHQELPACYFTRQFENFSIYLGEGKWESVTQATGPPWGKAYPKLNAMACFNEKGQGVGLFSPVANRHWNFGPVGTSSPSAKPTDNPCVHMAPIATVRMGPQTTLEYRYWLVVGSKTEIAASFDVLLKKYKKEKMKITDPD